MPQAESDVHTVLPDTEGGESAAASGRGRDLTGVLLAVFLALVTIEFILAREPWIRGRRKGAGA